MTKNLPAGAPDIDRLEQIFIEVIQVNVEPDGLEFHPDTVVGEEIREGLPIGLTAAFSEQSGKAAQWNNFVKKVRREALTPDLDEVVEQLKEFLWPPTQAIVEMSDFAKRWSPRGFWQ